MPWAGDVLGVQGEAAAGLGGALRFSMETPHLQMVRSREVRARTGVIPRCVRLWKVSLCTEARFADDLLGKVLAGIVAQWSEVFLNLIFFFFLSPLLSYERASKSA